MVVEPPAIPIPQDAEGVLKALVTKPHDALLRLYQIDPGENRERLVLEKVLWGRPFDEAERPVLEGYLQRMSTKPDPLVRQHVAQSRIFLAVLDGGMTPDRLRELYAAHHHVGRIFVERTPINIPTTVRIPDGGSGALIPYKPPVPNQTLPMADALEILADHVRYSHATGRPVDVTVLRSILGQVAISSEGRTALGLQSPTLPPWRQGITVAKKPELTRWQRAQSFLGKPLVQTNIPPQHWEQLGNFAVNPGVQIANIPVAIAAHVLVPVIHGDLTWEEAWDEVVHTGISSAILASMIIGWYEIAPRISDHAFGQGIKKVAEKVPPRARAFILPTLVIGTLVYAGWRGDQEMPAELASEYNENFLKEMVGGLGVQLVGTMGTQYGLSWMAARMHLLGRGHWATFLIGGAGAAAGFLGQEAWSHWYREYQREKIKLDCFVRILEILAQYDSIRATAPDKVKLLDRQLRERFAQLLGVLVLEMPSIHQVLAFSGKVAEERANMRKAGKSEIEILKTIGQAEGPVRSVTPREQEMMAKLFRKIRKHEYARSIPVSVLPAEQIRLYQALSNDIEKWEELMAHPKPLPVSTPDQWGLPEAISLLHTYAAKKTPFFKGNQVHPGKETVPD